MSGRAGAAAGAAKRLLPPQGRLACLVACWDWGALKGELWRADRLGVTGERALGLSAAGEEDKEAQ